MLYQVIIAAGLVTFLLNLILNLRNLKTPGRTSRVPAGAPMISVMIPARDEAANIGNCLESLRKQDYPNYEVLVLDDNSSDNTSEIVGEIAAQDQRVRLFRGKPLPDDWAGKPHACYQLAQEARGDWFLFVDADTTHAPYMLRSVLSLAIKLKTSLLSGFPRQLANSLPQKIAIPVLYFVILSWVPLWWLHRSRKPRPSLAIGQFLLFSRESYWRIGGHEAVKARILEDVWMGVETVRRGGRHVAIDLSPVVFCNMYRNIGAMWEGFIKWTYSVAAMSRLGLFALIVAGYFFFLAPFYWLWNEYITLMAPSVWRNVLLFQVGIILLMRGLIDIRFKEPLISAILHPLGFAFLVASALFAGGKRLVGAGVSWKKRFYGRESTVE
ncbi:MAG: glycosyltransferase [Dehalococcoidales bacterium]|nr:glycosyltransferase [Dehalococcoidales bacterium]